MIPKNFLGANSILKKPENWSDDQCADLPVFVVDDPTLKTTIRTSCWKITPEEMKEIKKTREVWLTVVGASHPPVLVAGISPFKVEGIIAS
jgi:hypothetical protein